METIWAWGVIGIGILVSVGIAMTGHLAWAQQEEGETILRCYHAGQAVATAPLVDTFLLRQQGTMLEARWVNPETREEEVLVTTLPCLYRVTRPPAGVPAD
jgi:protein-S-isoprenylcysteine O-methyltransferase Ste14